MAAAQLRPGAGPFMGPGETMMPPPPAFAPPPPGAPSQGPLRRSFESATCCAPCRAVVGRLPIRGWFMKADAGGGDGPGKGGGGGTGFYRWWRDEGGPPRPAKAALMMLLALTLLACWRQLTAVEGLGPLPWTEELSHYLQGLAAEWEVPAGSSYAKAIGGAGSRTELVDAIDQVLFASQMDARGETPGAPGLARSSSAAEEESVLLASAVSIVALADLSSRSLIPQIVRFRGDAEYWSERINPLWRLALETLSPPLGPALANKFPARSLERRIHECKVLKTAADTAAGEAQEALGRLHASLAALGSATDSKQLQEAVAATTLELESVLSKLDGSPLLPPDARGGDKARDARAALLRIRQCAVAHPQLGLRLDGNALLRRAHRNGAQRLVSYWPEAAVGLALFAAAAKTKSPSEMARELSKYSKMGVDYTAALLRENLKGPLQKIGAALFDKPTSLVLKATAEESRETLRKMVESFNIEINGPAFRKEGMSGVMKVYEREIRTPLKGALNGRMLRAGLIQVQEMKVNFETEMATVQRLLETQQLNLQIVAMLPALASLAVLGGAAAGLARFISADPLRPQQDLEAVLHDLSRSILAERTTPPGTAPAHRARGMRCLLAWEARRLLYIGAVPVPAREARQLRIDVARLASPQLPPEHLAMHLEGVFRQLPRTAVSFRL